MASAARYDVRLQAPRQKLSHIAVSTVDRHFAVAAVQRLTSAGRVEDAPLVVFWRGRSRWAVLDVASQFVGCGLLDPAVIDDLLGAHACA